MFKRRGVYSGVLTIVPIVSWHGAPAEGGPRPPYIFFCSLFTVLYDFIIHGREHVVNAVSVYCVLALYVPPYIIKLSSMVYVYPENRDPIDFGMGPPRA